MHRLLCWVAGQPSTLRLLIFYINFVQTFCMGDSRVKSPRQAGLVVSGQSSTLITQFLLYGRIQSKMLNVSTYLCTACALIDLRLATACHQPQPYLPGVSLTLSSHCSSSSRLFNQDAHCHHTECKALPTELWYLPVMDFSFRVLVPENKIWPENSN